jgi:hypothetical protein
MKHGTQQNSENDFQRWLGKLGIDRTEASLLGKTVRAIRLYESSKIVAPLDIRMLMTVMADGLRPKPWPE